jgi:hypothetical protein
MKIHMTMLALGMAATMGAAAVQAQPISEMTPSSASVHDTRMGPSPSILAARFLHHGTPAQRAWASSYYSERSHLMTLVSRGRMTSGGMQVRLNVWLQTNTPPMR